MANRPIMKIKIDGEMLKKQIFDKGYSLNSISKEIGVSSRTLRGYLNKNEMPPYIHEKIYVIVEDLRKQYSDTLIELAKIESKWLKRIPTKDEITRYHELIICAYELEQIIN